MKKITTAFIVLATFIPALAFASTDVTLTPSRTTATVGQYFTVAISINPSELIYTSKVALSYSSSNIQFSSFTQSANWLSLVQPGYDLVDASAGSIIKTGGYSKGVSSPVRFGTITFKATKVGTATISVAPGTQILNINNQNVSSGTANQIQIVIGVAPVIVSASSVGSTTLGISATTTGTSSSLVAAVGQSGSGWVWWLLLIVIILAIIIWLILRRRNNQNGQL